MERKTEITFSLPPRLLKNVEQTRRVSHYHCFCREPFPLLSPHFLEVRVGSVWPPSHSFQPHREIRMYTLFEWYLHVNNQLTRRKSRYNRWLAYWPIERWKWENDDLSEKIRLCLLTSRKNGRASERPNEHTLRVKFTYNCINECILRSRDMATFHWHDG